MKHDPNKDWGCEVTPELWIAKPVAEAAGSGKSPSAASASIFDIDDGTRVFFEG